MTTAKKRTLPNWLKAEFESLSPVVQKCEVRLVRMESIENLTPTPLAIDNISNVKSNDEHDDDEMGPPAVPVTHGYRTRRSLSEIKGNSPSRTRPVREKKAPAAPRPKPSFIEYNGKVEYQTEMHDIALASDQLLEWVNKQNTDEMIPIGFDMEWPFTFVTGPGRTAVIQLCADVNICFVFHVFHLKKLPAALVALLTHDKVCLHGVNIKNDCRKLERDFPEVNAQKMIDQCIDLGVYCNRVCDTGGRWSMERLVWHVCRLKINKDKKVRNSKWHVMPLTAEQQIYAAIDVYISQVMYLKLRQQEIEKDNEARKFIEEFGGDALVARRKLL